MSINISRNENQAVDITKIVTKKAENQPRDERGRFTSDSFKLEKFTDEKMKAFNEAFMQPVSMERVETTAPFISNCIKDNGFLRQIAGDRQLYHAIYLGKEYDSYYLFFLKESKFGFRYNCGNFEEVLTAKDIDSLLKNFNPLEWDNIQKA